jgi:hypothetical protein
MTVEEWLLDSDPAIRWQVMRDLTEEPANAVAAERSRVAPKAQPLDRTARMRVLRWAEASRRPSMPSGAGTACRV